MVYPDFLLTTLILIWRGKVHRRVAESAVWAVATFASVVLYMPRQKKNGTASTAAPLFGAGDPRGGTLGIV
jgi:hypothetical protein